MARIREFDPKDAVDQAMKVFWRKGYANTSIDDLVQTLGVSRHGLYAEFQSKRGLFLACLDHYQEAVVTTAFGMVEQPGASVDEICAYFASLLKLSGTKEGQLGCLMANTAIDVSPYDRCARIKVNQFRARLHDGFNSALSNAKIKGHVPAALEAKRVADFFTCVVQGLSLMARSRADPKVLANVASTALACLR